MSDLTPPNVPDRWVPPLWVRALVRPVGGRPALIVELLIFWMFFQYFSFAQENIRGGPVESIAHAKRLHAFEQSIHIDIERSLNHGLASVPVLAQAAGYYYGVVLATVPLALAWVWVANPHGFRRLRRLLVVTTLPSLLVFWLFPMAPPRFTMPDIVDINYVYDILGGALARDPSRSANLYAAMPSLHVAWSTWVGYALYDSYKRRNPIGARVALAYPIFTAWNVMATGNHFVLDIAGGLTLFALGLGYVTVMRGAEERIWPGTATRPEDSSPQVAQEDAAFDASTSAASARLHRGGSLHR